MGALISVGDAAQLAGVHVQTVRRWIWAGQVRAYKRHGANRLWVEQADIEKLMQPVAVGPAGAGAGSDVQLSFPVEVTEIPKPKTTAKTSARKSAPKRKRGAK